MATTGHGRTTEQRRAAFVAARKAAGHTQESLAEALHVDRATIIRWEAGKHAPLPYLRPKLARLLRQSPSQLSELIEDPKALGRVADIGAEFDLACEWLDHRSGWPSGTSRTKLASRLARIDVDRLRDRDRRRGAVGRTDINRALAEYYRDSVDGYGTYQAQCDGREVATAVYSRADWLSLACALTPASDLLTLSSNSPSSELEPVVDGEHAIRRLAEIATLDVGLTNAPLYRLLKAEVGSKSISGELDIIPFIQYALTTDLLEGELVDRLAYSADGLPLRDQYLPTLDSVLDVAGRVCSGGVLALCAIARPADPYRGPADYLLLVQQRAEQVLNSAGLLSVIPKGFHQPLTDYRSGAHIASTLRRELEEELFGRGDVDVTSSGRRVADPMHPNRLSDPMRWLFKNVDSVTMECTGFGFNLVNGNYEFASIVVIDDEEFWATYGGHIEANWESVGLQQYSSLDRRFLAELAAEESWSNEGLFAFLLGLQRLVELDDERVNVPEIDWGLR